MQIHNQSDLPSPPPPGDHNLLLPMVSEVCRVSGAVAGTQLSFVYTAPGFSSIPVPSSLQVEQDRNQSPEQPPEKLEH